MPTQTSQSSFIPKRGLARTKRIVPTRNIFIFTLIVYSLIFSSLLAAGASFLYKNHSMSLLQNEVTQLDAAIDTFSVSDLSTIAEFELTLQRANDRFSNTVSVADALNELAAITAEPIQIKSLSMNRSGDESLVLVADIAAQSFDSALFQRQELVKENTQFSNVSLEGVTVTANAADGVAVNSDTSVSLVEQPISYTATLIFPITTTSNAAGATSNQDDTVTTN